MDFANFKTFLANFESLPLITQETSAKIVALRNFFVTFAACKQEFALILYQITTN